MEEINTEEETAKEYLKIFEGIQLEETSNDSIDIRLEENGEGGNLMSEQEDSNADSSEQNSPHAVLEITVLSSDSDGNSSTSETSSLDHSTVPTDFEISSSSSDISLANNLTAHADSDGSNSISDSSSADNTIDSCGSGPQSHNLQWRNLIRGLITRKKRSMIRLSTFPQVTKTNSLHAALRRITSSKDQTEHKEISIEVAMAKPTWRNFEYSELAAATDAFSPERLIGKGGHAEVYKGCLADGQVIAVKRLTKGASEGERTSDFLSELGIIAHVNHPNAAQLLGFSVERGLHLILKFSPHGSLASVLHGTEKHLDWKNRFQIAIGIAEGLLYLHDGCQRRIIHRDIKASNILLTEDFQPQISDFGLAKWLPNKWNHHIVFPIEGTFGYMAPEYFMHGVVNEKIDVFAYGVLLLELITGRKAVDSSRQSLVMWAKPLLEENGMSKLIDSSLGDAYDSKEMSCALQIASMCIHHLSNSRPTMNEVVRLLKGEDKLSTMLAKESSYKLARPPLFDGCEMEDYTCSRYLNDLSKHKQLALEQ